MFQGVVPTYRWVFMAAAFLTSGCTVSKTIPREGQKPGQVYERALVYVKGGTAYHFDRVEFFPDSLTGETRVEVAHGSDPNRTYYQNELRSYHLPLNNVDSVVVVRRDMAKTALCAGGAVAIGALIGNMAHKSGGSSTGTSGGKGPGPGP